MNRTAACIVMAALLPVFSGPRASEPDARRDTAANELLLTPSASVDGESFEQMTGRWWRWAFDQPIAPYLDPDGRLCELGQRGPVWFLAGTNGSFRPLRRCVVPAGKHLLVPVINRVYVSTSGGNVPTGKCAELQAGAAVANDRLASAVVMIDGRPVDRVTQYRVRTTQCFLMNPDEPASIAAADGYWLLIKPLSPGRHHIVVGANYGDGGSNQNFEYDLDIGGQVQVAVRDGGPTSARGASD